MKINKKILHLPPYISTSWNYVSALRAQGADLHVYLTSGAEICVPNLKPDTLENIFMQHVSYLEDKEAQNVPPPSLKSFPKMGEPVFNPGESLFKIGLSNAEGLNAAMQHNPALAHSPDLPAEVLEKIGAISKIIAPEDMIIPKAEPHCNCPYCQIARCLHGSNESESAMPAEEKTEEEVKEEELQFQEWEITQSGEKLFTVVNKLDSQEKYSVYLGHPVGCTCGKEGCEHILAVLKS